LRRAAKTSSRKYRLWSILSVRFSDLIVIALIIDCYANHYNCHEYGCQPIQQSILMGTIDTLLCNVDLSEVIGTTIKMAASKDLNLMPLAAIQRLQEVVLKAQGGMSQRALANKLGVSQSILSDWLSGNVKEWPTTGRINKLAECLGISPGQLLDFLTYGKACPSPSIEHLIGLITSHSLTLVEAARISQAASSHALQSNFSNN
jgi:transcriptional regulator with XRE-family HTH domain